MRNFLLRGFNKHLSWFRCNGKGKHLNPAQTHNSEANQLTANALQNFQQLHPRFRSQAGLEYRGMQTCPGGASGWGTPERAKTCPGGASGWGTPERANRTAQASEPRQNTKDSLQHIERLSIAKFQQESPLVQMQWKSGASEPRSKAESGSQTAYNKHIARLSATAPEVQMPNGFGTAQNANTLWRYF